MRKYQDMRKNSFFIIAFLVITFVVFAIGNTKEFDNSQVSGERTEDNVLLTTVQSISGQALYYNNCSSCHQKNLEGIPPTFPSLKNISHKLSEDELSNILLLGKGAMPSFSHLNEEERKAIISFINGENIYVNSVANLSSEQNGKKLFIANCVKCHKVKTTDPEPAGIQNYGMRPNILGGIHNSISMDSFEHILNIGPCYMPSFDHMPSHQKGDIYKYLSTIDESELGGNTNNCSCRNNCWK